MKKRIDPNSPNTTPPYVGKKIEKETGLPFSVFEEFADTMEEDATSSSGPLSKIKVPEILHRRVTLYIARTEGYYEMGITFVDEPYFPWLGKWRTNGEGKINSPIDVADGGWPGYTLELDSWPKDMPRSIEKFGWKEVRPLTAEEKTAVSKYLEVKHNLLDKYSDKNTEFKKSIQGPTKELESSFNHLYS